MINRKTKKGNRKQKNKRRKCCEGNCWLRSGAPIKKPTALGLMSEITATINDQCDHAFVYARSAYTRMRRSDLQFKSTKTKPRLGSPTQVLHCSILMKAFIHCNGKPDLAVAVLMAGILHFCICNETENQKNVISMKWNNADGGWRLSAGMVTVVWRLTNLDCFMMAAGAIQTNEYAQVISVLFVCVWLVYWRSVVEIWIVVGLQ